MSELNIVFWHWWMLALGFLVLELMIAGFFFLWFAVSAGLVGLLLFVGITAGFDTQVLIFSLFTIIAVLGWRKYASQHPAPQSDHPLLNRRGEQYIGRTFDLLEPIVNGQGKIKVDDSLWKVVGADSPLGSKVKVVAVQSTLLVVERID